MRIRKRFLPSSQPLSDPQLNRSLVVQQAHTGGNLCVQVGNTSSQPSDPPNQTPSDEILPPGNEKTRWVLFGAPRDEEKAKQKEVEGVEVKDERWREEEKSNDTRKGSILGVGVVLQPSGSSHQVGRWCEGDKVVPLKKRRVSFERRVMDETIIDKEKKMKAKMKSKTNKKCTKQNGAGEEEEGGLENSSGVKKSKRGSVIMEGSRCSRVNGRGWRCCQQTLVGYSLCEHHLGKGRLRSMTSVPNPPIVTTTTTTTTAALEKDDRHEKQQVKASLYENTDDEEKPLMVTKKRMKIGMVKARTISSLLSQTNDTVLVADSNNKS